MVRDSESGKPLPASILLRVAEAADGLRDGKKHWFLISKKAPHTVKPFDSEKAGKAALAKRGRDKYLLLGPFQTPAEKGVGAYARRRKPRKIRSIEIYFEGEKKPYVISPVRVDALFFTTAALDKFAIPYYCRVRGAEQAVKMRKSMLSSEQTIYGHLPWTDWDEEEEENGENGDY